MARTPEICNNPMVIIELPRNAESGVITSAKVEGVKVERRRVAILAIDVAGYSRLMGANEEGTLRALTTRRHDVGLCTRNYSGRMFGVAGDSMMAEFADLNDAVTCSLAIQQTGSPTSNNDEIALHLRVGVHVGDVLVEGEMLYGEDVNITARLEGLAEPGGICLSNDVFDSIGIELQRRFTDFGFHHLKNIREPVQVWRSEFTAKEKQPQRVAQLRPAQYKPSIVVLPFENNSRDPEQEYFCDGLTDDLTTELSRFSALFVISPHSARSYKGKQPTPEQLGAELGVRYILTGSVRKSSDQVQLTVRLIDATTGFELWAERSHRKFADFFNLQEDIVQKIISTLAIRVESAEVKRVLGKSVGDMSAYELYLRAVHSYVHDDVAALKTTIDLLRIAVERDPGIARAWGFLGYTTMRLAVMRDTARINYYLKDAEECVRKALTLEVDDYGIYWDWAQVLLAKGDTERAKDAYRRAVELNSNDADLLVDMADLSIQLGDVESAIPILERAKTLNPLFPSWYSWVHGFAYYMKGQYAQAEQELLYVADDNVDALLVSVVVQVRLNNLDAAQDKMNQFLKHRPHWTLDDERERNLIKVETLQQDWLNDLQVAGLPVRVSSGSTQNAV